MQLLRMTTAWMISATIALATLQACSTPPRDHAVPMEQQDRAIVPGTTARVRTWGLVMNPDFMAAVEESVSREQAALTAAGHTGELPRADFLAVSGGGSNGAFGAGLLCGWQARGDRPAFKLITGISTGALIAPFAFAGPEWDSVLREVYTQTSTKDLITMRSVFAAIFDDAMADNAPMWKLLSKFVDQKLIDAIAAEHRKGRILVIGTTNLDARRAVLWNIGEIAASGDPGALELIRKLMIASASIPGAFPPVLIDVDVDGEHFQEMHVDGGAMTQVFLYPPTVNFAELAKSGQGPTRERRAYIIRNSRLDPDWAEVDRSTMTILGRAIDALIQTQGVGDLYRMYASTQRDHIDYNLAFIPASFKVLSKEPFDKEYMQQLFEVGYQMALKGYPWQKSPPGFDSPIIASQP